MAAYRPPPGFTLIELLVVIVVIAVLAGVATLAIGNRNSGTLRSEARRLQQLLIFARDEATYRYRHFGLRQDKESYQLQVYNALNGKWETPEEALFKPHRLPPPLRLSIRIEGELVLPATEEPEEAKKFRKSAESVTTSEAPQLLMFSSGETTPFEIRLRGAENPSMEATLASDGFSAITLVYHNTSL